MESERQKLLIIGWDGATWAYIDPLLADGKLPYLQSLLDRGTKATLTSTLPPYTNVAWPSMVTGSQPQETGLYDATRLEENSYKRIPLNATSFRGVTLWDWLNHLSYRCAILNVPMTYPASEIDGVMVSGFDSPIGSDNIASPRGILQKWQTAGHAYKTLAEEVALMDQQNPHHPRGPVELFSAEWQRITLEQGDFVHWLWDSGDNDCLFVVFSGTDSINHRTNDLKHIEDVYVAADVALGKILAAADDNTLICMVSDHGSTPARRYLSLNRLLHDAGMLSYKQSIAPDYFKRLPSPLKQLERLWAQLPNSIKNGLSAPVLRIDGRLKVSRDNVDWSNTKAFALTGLGAIYVNHRDIYPDGCVDKSEFDELQTQLISHLEEATDEQGTPLFQKVWRGLEAYPNSVGIAPDIVCVPNDFRDHMIPGFPGDPVVRPIPNSAEYGTHTPDGILVLAGPNINQSTSLYPTTIPDVMPTLLAGIGLPLPHTATGRVIEEAFTEHIEFRIEEADTFLLSNQQSDISQEANDEIVDRLKALGYLE